VDLAGALRRSMDLVRPVAETRSVALASDIADQPVLVEGSAPLLEQLCTNILSNAIRHSSGGGTVTAMLAIRDHTARLTFQDTGEGMSSEVSARAFDRFFRADPARSGEGFGLGLAISKSIVGWHNGSISIDSRLGRGTTVHVDLPLGRR
jgi:signal transduction histidine kinase